MPAANMSIPNLFQTYLFSSDFSPLVYSGVAEYHPIIISDLFPRFFQFAARAIVPRRYHQLIGNDLTFSRSKP